MKRFISCVLTICMLLMLLCGCGGGNKAPESNAPESSAPESKAPESSGDGDTIKFGMFYEMTGDMATNGERHYRAATMAIDEINANGGVLGKQIELVTADDASTNAGAVTALEILLAEDVDCLIGPGFSSMCLAVADTIAAEGIPTIISGTSLALVEEGMPKNWFRNLPPDDIADQGIADFQAGTQGLTKFYVVYENTTYGTGNLKYFTEALAKYNVEILGSSAFNAGDTDFTAQIMAAQEANPECVVFFSASSADAAIIARQVKELGSEFIMQGSMQFGSGVTKGLAGDAMNGIYAFQSYNKASSDLAGEFNDKYQSLYNEPADHFNGWVRDAIYVVADAMERAGTTDYEAVVKALSETEGVPGVCGELTCDERNELQHNVSIVLIEDGEYIVQKINK
ncbi:MAG: ABC transporter substrate-binding protein [Candidatus Heteroscillospira sp.]|jgi:branched-chain amino acid transport system substrate-binding protein